MSEFKVSTWAEVWSEERASLGFEPLLTQTHLEKDGKSVHAAPRPQGVALCLSGGGIRSATFALGVLQGLAKNGLLHKFDYLSTVSGGGYIGSWLSAWVNRLGPRDVPGIKAVEEELAQIARNEGLGNPGVLKKRGPFKWLRDYSNYLSPRLGFGSLDMWTMIATYVRNLLINWTLFVPLLVAVLLPAVGLRELLLWDAPAAKTRIAFGAAIVAVLTIIGAIVVAGFSFSEAHHEKSAGNPSRGRISAAVVACLATSAACAALGWAMAGGTAVLKPFSNVFWLKPGVPGTLVFLLAYIIGIGKIIVIRQATGPSWRGVVRLIALLCAGVLLNFGWDYSLRNLLPVPVPGDGGGADAASLYVCFAFPVLMGAVFLAATAYMALTSQNNGRLEEEVREWWARLIGWVGLMAVAWLAVAAIALYGPYVIDHITLAKPLGVGSGLLTMLLAASPGTGGTGDPQKRMFNWREIGLALVAPVFAVLALCACAKLVAVLLPLFGAYGFLRLALATLLLILFVQWSVNLNKFSMHSFYRHRLVRAYLGASRRTRNADRFTGFDPDDNVQMYDLRSRSLTEKNIPNAPSLLREIQTQQCALSKHLARFFRIEENDKQTPALVAAQLDQILLDHFPEDIASFRSVHWQQNEETALLPSVWARLVRDCRNEETRYMARRRLLEWAYPGLVLPGCERPLHVVNTALNMTVSDDLGRQERQARSFTITPQHCGSAEATVDEPVPEDKRLGFRRSRLYGGRDGVSLGTAVAVSGAAVNSSMGYHSSRAVSFLMTMFNVRLGAWLGNPGKNGGEGEAGAFRRPGPRWALLPVLREAALGVGMKSKYVHLSDGGHFENLGLYEMVRRRCKTIVVCDAGCDRKFKFEDLSNAIRRARADLGVQIELKDVAQLRPAEKPDASGLTYSSFHFTWGKVRYPDNKTADLLYIKPTLRGDVPQDVLNYAANNDGFPHQSTGDQFFSETQFESYRALGEHIGSGLASLEPPVA